MDEVDLTGMARDDTVIIRLPNGRLIELEWLDGENNSMIIQGFEGQKRYEADETYRTSGVQPQLRSFSEHIRMAPSS